MAKRFIEDYLLFQMAIVSHVFSVEFYDHLRKHGLTPSRWRILLNLSGLPGMYITQLAEHTCYEQSRVTKSVNQMIEEGLVKKLLDKADKRRVFVSITAKGEKAIAPLIKEAKAHEKSVLTDIPKEDRAKLKSILSTLVKDHVDAIEEPIRMDNMRRARRRA